MFISSSNTKKAKQELEKIKLEGVETGKALLKDFLNRELKILSAKRNSPTVINASESDRSNIYKFANLLKDEKNMELFKNAIEKQAKSKGTKESGLFNKLIYPIRNNWVNSKSQIKTFLLAHEDRQISADEDKYIGENIEDLDDESRKSLRMKNKNIADKLKSNRLSNVLKVFMALVMWDYIIIKENEGKKKENLKNTELVWGDDKDYFYDEKVSKSGLVGRWRSSFGKHIVETVENSNVKIFPKGKPLPSEVRQAGVGDCYLMAALIALAKTNPKAITDCFVQGLDKIENEDQISIRLFYAGKYITTDSTTSLVLKNVKPVIITIDKNKVIMPQRIKDGALWPKLIEKAYVIYRKDGYSIELPFINRNRLDGGREEYALFAITGQNKINVLNNKFRMPFFGGGNKVIEPIDTIERKLGKSRSLVCTFKKRFKTKDVKSNEEILIYNRHAYAIVGINKEKKYIRLIEPNKHMGRITKPIVNTEWPEWVKEGGHIAMSFDDFKKNVDSISYTSGNNMYFDKEI